MKSFTEKRERERGEGQKGKQRDRIYIILYRELI